MVIFEEGGELARHEDPVNGALGTLVIDVSWLYRGGLLVVHSPGSQSKTYEWVRGNLDNKSITYAAFRADCEYQVQPVEEGYCVLLMYKLLVPEGVSTQPRYTTDHPDFVEVRSALDTYFLSSEVRTVCNSSDLSWYPKEKQRSERPRIPGGFVYLLDHRYTTRERELELFKDKDRIVGSSLARYCYHSSSPYTLYVGNFSYLLAYDPAVDYEAEGKEMERTLKFESGTCQFFSSGGHNAMGISHCHDGFQVDVRTEAAPIGRLDSVSFDSTRTKRTRNKGSRRESWFKGTALVIMPLRTELARR